MKYTVVRAQKIAHTIKLKTIEKKAQNAGFDADVFPEALVVTQKDRMAIFFSRGVVVEWLTTEKNANWSHQLLNHQPEEITATEEYRVALGKKLDIVDENLTVDSDDIAVLISISHALVRSVQLENDEIVIEKLMQRIGSLPRSLKETGKIRMKEKTIRKMIGEVLETKHALSTFGQANDRPELLWDDASLRRYYQLVATELELRDRSLVIQNKISTIEDTLAILRDEANTKHSHFLEVIIILLFIFDICIYIFFE